MKGIYLTDNAYYDFGVAVVVIIWYFDLQLQCTYAIGAYHHVTTICDKVCR